jgi:hypothetical protein
MNFHSFAEIDNKLKKDIEKLLKEETKKNKKIY